MSSLDITDISYGIILKYSGASVMSYGYIVKINNLYFNRTYLSRKE